METLATSFAAQLFPVPTPYSLGKLIEWKPGDKLLVKENTYGLPTR
jgi:hypothetical protein